MTELQAINIIEKKLRIDELSKRQQSSLISYVILGWNVIGIDRHNCVTIVKDDTEGYIREDGVYRDGFVDMPGKRNGHKGIIK